MFEGIRMPKFTVRLIGYTPIEKEFEVECEDRAAAIDLARQDRKWTIVANGEELELGGDLLYEVMLEGVDVEV